jgi:hypothetical protein
MQNNKQEIECCPKFDPEPWQGKEVTWQDKLFIRDTVPQLFHIPLPGSFGKAVKCGSIRKTFVLEGKEPAGTKPGNEMERKKCRTKLRKPPSGRVKSISMPPGKSLTPRM